MGSRSRIFAPKTHLPLNQPPAPQPETMADGDVSACFDAGNSFNTKLKDALSGLVKANNDRKSEIDAPRGDHDQLKKDHDALEEGPPPVRMISARTRSSLSRRSRPRTTPPGRWTLPSWTASWTLRMEPGRLRLLPSTPGPRERTMPARLRLPT